MDKKTESKPKAINTELQLADAIDEVTQRGLPTVKNSLKTLAANIERYKDTLGVTETKLVPQFKEIAAKYKAGSREEKETLATKIGGKYQASYFKAAMEILINNADEPSHKLSKEASTETKKSVEKATEAKPTVVVANTTGHVNGVYAPSKHGEAATEENAANQAGNGTSGANKTGDSATTAKNVAATTNISNVAANTPTATAKTSSGTNSTTVTPSAPVTQAGANAAASGANK